MFIGFISKLNWLDVWNAFKAPTNNHTKINTTFWICLLFIVCFHYFKKIVKSHLKAAKFSYYKWDLTVRYIWNCCFYFVAFIFLHVYRKYSLADSLYFKQNGQNYYRSYENLLFFSSSNRCSEFSSINFILLSFYLIDVIYDLNERNISEALSKFLVCCIVVCFDAYGLEYFSVIFNILLALIYLFTDGLRLVCWHIPDNNLFAFCICATLQLLLWSFVFLKILPFNFLIPTIYGRKFHVWLNLFLLLWYGSCVWNSPVLQYVYHQIYHTHNNSNDCPGKASVCRCILLRETNELRHIRNVRKALLEIQLADIAQREEPNSSQKTYQTIKCMIALKRKLKRIRENKDQMDSSQ